MKNNHGKAQGKRKAGGAAATERRTKERGEQQAGTEEDIPASMLVTLQNPSPPRSPPLSETHTSIPREPDPTENTTTTFTPPSSFPPGENTSNNTSPTEDGNPDEKEEAKCQLRDCALCTRGIPVLLIRSPTWASIMRVVFFCLQYDKQDKVFFNLKTDIYGFIISHWKKLSLNKKRSDNWHKQIQDMLSHSKNLFESGMEKYKQNGFWRMKQTQDPWTMHRPRTYNWTKRSPRTHDDGDPDYVTVFDVATGVVIKGEGEMMESPRKKIKSKDEATETAETGGPDEQKQQLEEQVRELKKALAEMSDNLANVKDELKRKDQEMMERAYAYQRTLEQFEELKLAQNFHIGDDRSKSALAHTLALPLPPNSPPNMSSGVPPIQLYERTPSYPPFIPTYRDSMSSHYRSPPSPPRHPSHNPFPSSPPFAPSFNPDPTPLASSAPSGRQYLTLPRPSYPPQSNYPPLTTTTTTTTTTTQSSPLSLSYPPPTLPPPHSLQHPNAPSQPLSNTMTLTPSQFTFKPSRSLSDTPPPAFIPPHLRK